MTRDEFSDLAALWSAPGVDDEQRELERIAKRTPAKARLVQWGELAAVAMLTVAIGGAIVWRLGASTLLIGSLLLVLLAWSAWKRHRLSDLALLIDQSDRLSFVASTLRAKQAELERSAIGLVLVPPGLMLAMIFGYVARGEGKLGAFLLSAISTPRGLITLSLVACALVVFVHSHMRLLREVRWLRRLRQEYEDEAQQDGLGGC